MAQTSQEHLDLINAVITARLNGDAYESYTEQMRRFSGTKLAELYEIRRNLQQQVNAENGGSFGLVEPFGDNGSPGPLGML